jgi:F-type H+-transporting ATPase subunit b
MNINASLLGQALAFAILIWFMVKFIWPPLISAIEERQKKIADGLAAADKGAKSLDEAKAAGADIIKEARAQAAKIADQAGRRSSEMIEEAKTAAVAEGQRLLGDAKAEVALESNRARAQLSKEVATLAVTGASKLLGREIDAKAHADLLDKLALEIERG